ncbi:hypothetical protein Tco_0835409 [Tanacetum coccineum]
MAALKYKDDHNKIAYLGRERGCEDFTDILSYLDHSPLRYALTHDPPVVFDSLVKQFWATAVVRPNAAGSHDLVATIDGRSPIPLTNPHACHAVAGNELLMVMLLLDEIIAVNEAAGSAAEAPLVPHSTPVSPVREPTLEQQPRPWPYVSVHSPMRDHTPEPASPPTPPAQTFIFEEPFVFGPEPRPAGPDNYLEPEDLNNVISIEDDTTHGGFHKESPARPDDAPTPTADAAGRAEDPVLLTSLSEKLDRCMGCIDSLETELGTTKKIMRGAILTLVSRVKKLEKTVKQLRTTRLAGDVPAAEGDVDIQDDFQTAGPSAAADKGKAPMPELDIPAEFLAEDAQARKRFEEEQASERLVQRLQAEDLAQEVLPNVSEQRAKELDELMMRMTETDWLNLMMQVGSNPALARELLGADVTEENFIERMTAIKERKKRALADLRYRALKGKPLKQSEVTQMMRNLVKNQWCAAHNGTITMTAVKAMTKQQLLEEYEYICRRLEKDRLLSAQYNLFRPKPAITEPPSKRQRLWFL